MNTNKTGGAAYPRTGFYPDTSNIHNDDLHAALACKTEPAAGMTLLDHFAGVALNGLIAMSADGPQDRGLCAKVAKLAYSYAEEMIKRRRDIFVVNLIDQTGPDAPPPPPPPPPPTHWQPGMNFGPPDLPPPPPAGL